MKFVRRFALATAIIASTVAAQDVRVDMKIPADRKPAPAFSLEDTTGKSATLADYPGRVVLLDFWATWCGGCKKEIPWFIGFSRQYAPQGLSVVGAAMDDEGWKVVKPFLAQNDIPYRIVVGDDALMKRFDVDSLPDTFLIDKHGRLAATYSNGLVDRANIEANIKSLLAEP